MKKKNDKNPSVRVRSNLSAGTPPKGQQEFYRIEIINVVVSSY